MSFRRGLKPSTPSKTRHRLDGALHPAIALALTGALPASDTIAKSTTRKDQGESETCFAHSAISCAECTTGFPPGSPLCLASCTYADVRATANPTGGLPPLQDTGAELQDAADALRRWGMGPLAAQISGRSGVSDVPDDQAGAAFPEPVVTQLEVAGHDLITGEYSIPVDANAPRTVAAAIVAGMPVWLGTLVGQAFQALTASEIAQPTPTTDSSAGGHAMYLSGYRTADDGSYEFRVENSWGSGWCDNGACWASTAWLLATWELWPFPAVAA